ncbi:DUF1294 domain-containing protein [Bacillus methanolicus]|uniref:DUF1294 domain-containing protein n=1 Tax=Bacillus methanolicus TaxID=1471 RepID=UPI002380A222|nr:DUF1294 domain-containing protein [Bacillus methanolicus]MDE3839859.1 DUF1294 domain-containing protein [Bacillus methanolicus]
MEKFIFWAFASVNIIGLLLMRIDKMRAKHKQYRISENTLWAIAFLGGAIGMTMGMRIYRHKTKHLSFKLGFPVLALLQGIFIVYFLALLS